MSRTRLLGWLLVALAVAGCPKREIPKHPDVPSDGNPDARHQFEAARTRFERDERRADPQEFEAIARDFPDDPIAPYARFYAGRAALRAQDYQTAVAALSAVLESSAAAEDETLRLRARFFLGLSYGYLGEHQRGLELLAGAEGADETERGERVAVMAAAAEALGQFGSALGYYLEWYDLAAAAERAYILDRLVGLQERVADSPDRALIARASDAVARVRRELGVELPGPAANPGLVGAALPLSGRRARVGEAAMRGLSLAAGTYDATAGAGVRGGGAPSPFTLSTVDARSEAAAAPEAVDKLSGEGAIAIVGPLDTDSVRSAAGRAAELGIPMVALDAVGGLDDPSPFVYHIVLAPEARARALAVHAAQAGVKRFAILRPEIEYGERVARAFREEVERRGGTVIAEAHYDAKATSFGKVIDSIRGKPWDGLFIPDTGRRLELILPALASANLQVQPRGAPAPKVGRGILLLSTAEALAPAFLRGAGRYSHGAVFAPGFYADDADPIIRGFAERYQAAFGHAPIYLDAYAYDAAAVVRAVVEAGARTRAEVSAGLASAAVEGLTGTVAFGADRRRSDSGLLFVVERGDSGDYAIHALR